MEPAPISKQHYEAPEVMIFELTTDNCVLQASRNDYEPITW